MKLFYEKVLSVLVESRALSAEQVRKIRVNFEQANLSFEAYLAQRFKISSVLILQAKSKVAQLKGFGHNCFCSLNWPYLIVLN